jgi:hypothetical protein
MGFYTIMTTKPRSEWVRQANEGMGVMQSKGYKNIEEFAEKDKENCSKMLQAFDALGASVDEKLAKKCGLRRYVDERKLGEVI